MSAILSPPDLHKAFTEDKGCKGITTAASADPVPSPHPATRPAAERRSPGACGSLAQALRPEVVGAVQSRVAELFPSFIPCPVFGNPPWGPLHLWQTSPTGPVCWVLSTGTGTELPRVSNLDWAGTFLCVCDVLLAAQSNQSLFAGGLNESTMQNITLCRQR